MYLNDFAESYFEPKIYNLVEDSNRDAFLQALDDGYFPANRKASWFEGQQVAIDITGTVIYEWSTRKDNSHRFNEL